MRDPIRHKLEGKIVTTTDTWPDRILKHKQLLMQVSLGLFLGYRAS